MFIIAHSNQFGKAGLVIFFLILLFISGLGVYLSVSKIPIPPINSYGFLECMLYCTFTLVLTYNSWSTVIHTAEGLSLAPFQNKGVYRIEFTE